LEAEIEVRAHIGVFHIGPGHKRTTKKPYCSCNPSCNKKRGWECCGKMEFVSVCPKVIAECSNKNKTRDYSVQEFYQCETCWGIGSNIPYGCCPACARDCHEGHKLKHVGAQEFFCDCAVNDHRLLCTNNINLNGTKIDSCFGKAYNCEDCNGMVCRPCAKKCHSKHKVVFVGVENFVCPCNKISKCLLLKKKK